MKDKISTENSRKNETYTVREHWIASTTIWWGNHPIGFSSPSGESSFSGPWKPSLLSPRSSWAAFSRNSLAAAWTFFVSDDWYFLLFWTLLSVYLILVPSPLLISFMFFLCSALEEKLLSKNNHNSNGTDNKKVFKHLPGVRSGKECSMKRVAAW